MSFAKASSKTSLEGFVPPPMGGLNTSDPAASMPESDAIALKNLIPSELGLRCRLGSSEWVTGLDGPARTAIPFNGAAANGAGDRYFVTTATGIWDCTSSTQTPSRVYTFTSAANSAGIGVAHTMVTSAGHFLAYCDEENGYHVYRESTDTWQAVQAADTTAAWVAATAYTAGQYVKNGGNVYLCTTGGTSAGSGGPSGTGASVADNDVVWAYNWSVSGVTPANLVHVLAWKNRLWFTERDTAKAWYLDVNAIGGTATSFNFGGQFKVGGPLVGLWNWTTDGGQGMDDYLVALSGAGDVVVYAGTDPSTADTFGLKGVWTVGALPKGRKVATEFGGDVLVASILGLVPLSKLVLGNVTFDRSQYLTAKVQNLFNYYTGLYGQNTGWALVLDPKENALLVLVPNGDGSGGTQLAMSLATKGWFPFSGLPMACAAPWNGVLYFGTTDGRVLKHDGYVDGVLLADADAQEAIPFHCVSAFSNLGTPRQKRCGLIRPRVLAQSAVVPLAAQARWDFDVTAPRDASDDTTPTEGWDVGTWDTAVWGGDFSTTQKVFGATGSGSFLAVAVEGLANSRTIYVGADVSFQVGGFL